MPDTNDYDAGPFWDFLGDPQGVATAWLEGWLLGQNVGLPDLYAYSRVLWTVKETGQSIQLDFSQLKGQPVLTAGVLAHLVLKNAGEYSPRVRTHASLLGNALTHLSRDFESLLAAGRAPDSGVAMLRANVRAVREAWTLLLDPRQVGAMSASSTVAGWSRLAPIARGLALATTEGRDAPADRLPMAASVGDTFADLDAYLGALLDALAFVPAAEATTNVEPSVAAVAVPRPEWITSAEPAAVRVECALMAEELRIQGTKVRRAALPPSVWTLLAERVAASAAVRSASTRAVEHRWAAAGALRVEAKGRFGTALRAWWRERVGPGDPLIPAGTKGEYYVAFAYRIAPESKD